MNFSQRLPVFSHLRKFPYTKEFFAFLSIFLMNFRSLSKFQGSANVFHSQYRVEFLVMFLFSGRKQDYLPLSNPLSSNNNGFHNGG